MQRNIHYCNANIRRWRRLCTLFRWICSTQIVCVCIVQARGCFWWPLDVHGHSKRNNSILTIGGCIKFENGCRSIAWRWMALLLLEKINAAVPSKQVTTIPVWFEEFLLIKCYYWWEGGGHYIIQQNVSWSLQWESMHIAKWLSLVGYVNTTISYSLGEWECNLLLQRLKIVFWGVQYCSS